MNVNLIGVDWSPVGVREATDRSTAFLPRGRSRFRVGELTATGLGAASIDGAVCADAIFFAEERVALFAEVARVLRPGGRLLFTADESDDRDRPAAVPDWAPIIEVGGFAVLAREEIPNWAAHSQGMYDEWAHWQGMYDEWVKNIDVLRAELGHQSAEDLPDEAKNVGLALSRRTGVLYIAEEGNHTDTEDHPRLLPD